MCIKKYIFFFLVFSNLKLNAQDPVCRVINNLSGLPSNTIYNILQDSIGFIWIAHDKGLSKYDGKQFFHYNAKAQQGKSLSNLLIQKSSIWCQDFAGNFYYTKNNELIKEPKFKSVGSYSSAEILKNNLIAVVNVDSLRFFDCETKKVSGVKINEGTMLASCVQNDKLFFLNFNSVFSFDGMQIKKERKLNNTLGSIFFLQAIDNQFYGFTKDKYPYLYQINQNNAKVLPILKSGLFIQDVNIIGDEIWISTSTGAYCFDKKFTPKYDGHCFFKNNSIAKIIKDKEGSYWFATLDKGLFLIPDINIRLFQYENETITTLANYKYNDDIILGTSKNQILHFSNNHFQPIYKSSTKHEVLDIYYDKNLDNTIFCSNTISYLVHNKKVKEIIAAGKNIISLNDSLLVVACATGINLVSKKYLSEQNVPLWLQIKNGIWQNHQYKILKEECRGRSVCFDSINKILYAANAKGLFYFSEKLKGEILYKNKPIFASQLKMQNGKLIAGTFSDGLYSIINNEATLLNEKKPQLTKVIYKLKIDKENIWIVGDELLQQYNSTTNELVNYNYSDGLPKAEIKDILITNNKVYVATNEGLLVFDNKKNSKNNIPPSIVLTSFLVNNDEENLGTKSNFKTFENNIQINFSLLSFKGIESAIIQYSINNGDWQYINNKNLQLNLPSLAPDIYKIKMRAFNEDGVASSNNIELSFTIEKPFYKTSWFYALIILAAVTLMYLYFKYRLGNEKKQNDLLKQRNILEKELQQSMLSSIKSQMNPHFLFNALNTIQSYIYTNDKENASHYLGKFSELTRMILDMSNKEIVSLADEIKALKLYIELEELRFEDKLHYHFEVDEQAIFTEATFIPSMLIQPYVENAIKHGLLHQKGKWRLNISFKKNNNSIEVVVDDNGIGRAKSIELNKFKNKHHQSFATNANQKRLEILNKDMGNAIALQVIDKIDAHGNATGTRVVINIPIVTNK